MTTKKKDLGQEMMDLLRKKSEGTPSDSSASQKSTRVLEDIEKPGTFVMNFELGSDKESDLTIEGPIPPIEDVIAKKDKEVSDDTVKQTKSTQNESKKLERLSREPEASVPPTKSQTADELKKEVAEFKEKSKPVLPTQFQFGNPTKTAMAQKNPTAEAITPLSGLGTTRAASIFNEVSQLVAGSEAVRVAQARITTLEKERDELRNEVEKLLSSSESFQRRMNESKAQYETLERKHRQKVEILEEEKTVIQGRLKAREQELNTVKKQYEDLQVRFQNDLRRVRVRERELESRLELLKAESATLMRTKDDLIVELKRQLEQLSFELDNFRAKSADLNSKVSELYERNHRTVKALRLALSVLELGDDDMKGKKASGS